MKKLRFRVQGLGIRDEGSGAGVQSSEIWVLVRRFEVYGSSI